MKRLLIIFLLISFYAQAQLPVVIATRCKYHSLGQTTTGITSCNYFSNHIIGANCSAIAIEYPGYYVDQSLGFTEHVNISTLTIHAVLRKNGVISQFLFSGISTGTITPGTHLISDYLSGTFVKGDKIQIGIYVQVAGGGSWSVGLKLIATDGEGTPNVNDGTSHINDVSLPTLKNVGGYTPIAILAQPTSTYTSVLLGPGDSEEAGKNADDNRAAIERILDSSKTAWANISVPGLSIKTYLPNGDFPGIKLMLSQMQFTHAISDIPGANDFFSSYTADSAYRDQLLVITYLHGLGINKIARLTTFPFANSSTDGYSTVGGQTMRTQNVQRAPFNVLLRTITTETLIEWGGRVAVTIGGVFNNDGTYWHPNSSNGASEYTIDGIHQENTGIANLGNDPLMMAAVAAFLAPTAPVIFRGRIGRKIP